MKSHHSFLSLTTCLCLAGSIALLPLPAVRAQTSGGAADEKTVRDLDAQWSAAAAAHDVDKVVSYYSADAVVMPPNLPAATTAEARRKAWEDAGNPSLTLSWKATKVEMARSGEMAVVTGTYDAVSTDSKIPGDHGKYMELLKKQPNGDWKCTLDIWNSDMTAPSAPTKS